MPCRCEFSLQLEPACRSMLACGGCTEATFLAQPLNSTLSAPCYTGGPLLRGAATHALALHACWLAGCAAHHSAPLPTACHVPVVPGPGSHTVPATYGGASLAVRDQKQQRSSTDQLGNVLVPIPSGFLLGIGLDWFGLGWVGLGACRWVKTKLPSGEGRCIWRAPALSVALFGASRCLATRCRARRWRTLGSCA